MDPFSYGYNRATPASAYITPGSIITSLIDIVSKNGNFLLDVGPTANGTIIAIEQTNLRAAGAWLKSHGRAIYNTTYWTVTPEQGPNIRFTQNQNNFFVLVLARPNGTIVLDAPVPFIEGDQVTVVGGEMDGSVVPSRMLGNGSLEISVAEDVVGADEYAWVFGIGFGGVERGSNTGSGSGDGSGDVATGVAAGRGKVGWVGLVVVFLVAVVESLW